MDYGLIGEHLPHSFSKIIHEKIGLYNYELHEVAKGDLDAFMKTKAFRGINVTIPYKQDVIPYLDGISPRAKAIGAVNTVVNRDGKLFGDNTDFGGMEALIGRIGLSLEGKKVLILGTGGTSRTAYAVAESLGAASVKKVSRRGAEGALTYEEAVRTQADAEVILNTTPCGMFPDSYAKPIALDAFGKLQGVADVIYNPLQTLLVQEAKEKGLPAAGGLYMLVAQAVLAAEIFTGKTLPADLTDRIYRELYREKRNIALIGMPGSGKSTVGRILQEKLDGEMIDTDAVIVEEQKMPVTEIFAKGGEAAFRAIETDVIRRVSMENRKIISTGGGAVLRPENVRALRTNGILVFLDRDPEALVPTGDRPLSDTAEKMKALYAQRYPIYRDAADIHLKVTGTAEETAAEICRRTGI